MDLVYSRGDIVKTIMVDMDDVLTYGRFTDILEDYLGYKPDYEGLNSFYMQDALGDKKKDFFEKFKSKNVYEDATLLPDCYDVLKKLSKVYKIYICTDYIWREIVEYSGDSLKNKFNFLHDKLDFINPRNYVFTADKSIVNCDIKIDDKLENLFGASQKLLFTAYHNKRLSKDELAEQNVVRVNDWKEIEKLLLNDFES